MRWRLGILLAIVLGGIAHAQGVVQQVGPIVTGHLAAWWGNGQIIDAGTAAGGGGGIFTGALRTITSGTLDTATLLDGTIAWNSSVASAKTQTIYACNSAVNGRVLVIKDQRNNGIFFNITIQPTGGTVDHSSTYVLASSGQGVQLQCNGSLSDWMSTAINFSASRAALGAYQLILNGAADDGALLNIAGNWSGDRRLGTASEGVYIRTGSGTIFNTNTTGGAINGAFAIISLNRQTLTSAVPVLYQQPVTFRIAGPPILSTNVTGGTLEAMEVAQGRVWLYGKSTDTGGGMTISADQQTYNPGSSGIFLDVNRASAIDHTLYTGVGTNVVTRINGTSFGGMDVSADNCVAPCTGVEYLHGATVYIAQAPGSSGIATVDDPRALEVASGASRFGGTIRRSGSLSLPAWGTMGPGYQDTGGNYTDTSTPMGTTINTAFISTFIGSTINAANTGVTITDAAEFYINTNVHAGTNVTITRPWALYSMGDEYMGGVLAVGTKTKPGSGINSVAYSANGNAGVTCAPGSPTSSFATNNGIVIHC